MELLQAEPHNETTPLIDFNISYAQEKEDGTLVKTPVRYVYWGTVKQDDLP